MTNWVKKIKKFEYNNLYPLFFTLIFIFILIQYSFSALDALFYDMWTRSDFAIKMEKNIVVVTMDEESDQFLGDTYPYTYATHVRFLKKLLKDDPSILSYFVPTKSIGSEDEKEYAHIFQQLILKYKQDDGGHFRFLTAENLKGEVQLPDSVASLGHSRSGMHTDTDNFAKDDVARRVFLNIGGEDTLHLWISNLMREINGEARINASGFKGAYYETEADATLGMFRYGGNPDDDEVIKKIPFHRVVVGNFPKGYFKNKTVLVGSQYISNPSDFVFTAYGKEGAKSSKMNVHAQIVNALNKNKTIFSLPNWITDIFSVLLAIVLSFVISKVQPTKGLLITMLILLSVFLLTYLVFVGFGVWIKISHVILSIFVVYYIWVPFRAIGEYQTRYAIQEETKVLKKVDKLKQNFISLMSHDLKTPVAKIAGIADILRVQYNNNDNQKELLDNIINSTKELNDFITSILDLTKVESRNITLRQESKDVNNLVEATVEKLRYEAKTNQMAIELSLGPLYPIKIDTDLINRVLSNIIGNAIKYAGIGTKIDIKTWDDDEWVYIDISDSGTGISEDEIEHIFEKFYRVKNDDSHKIKGTGLGLYLVKYFIELHHGKISVKSNLGEGTSFLIQLKNA